VCSKKIASRLPWIKLAWSLHDSKMGSRPDRLSAATRALPTSPDPLISPFYIYLSSKFTFLCTTSIYTGGYSRRKYNAWSYLSRMFRARISHDGRPRSCAKQKSDS
jgi:hypothetical protein